MRAYIYSYDPATTTWTPIFDFPLTYPKGYARTNSVNVQGWYPWSDNFATKVTTGTDVVHPEPILADIEFDIDGSMVLGFGDRTGLQTGYKNQDLSGAGSYNGTNGGDILRAQLVNGVFILENNAKVANNTGYGPNNKQGLGFGEFYTDDLFVQHPTSLNLDHAETVLGGLALRPGSGEVTAVSMDPVNSNIYPKPAGFEQTLAGSDLSKPYYAEFNAAGVRYMNNTTGQLNRAFQVYQTSAKNSNFSTEFTIDGGFAKSTGLGDVTLGCSLPTYLQIGNYVWNDTDKDGVQDACETSLTGVKVSLYKDVAGTLTKIAETTTNGSGEYYFSSKYVLGAAWTGTGADTTLLPNQAYKVVFGQTQYTGGLLTVGANAYTITQKDATANTGNDQNDSDAAEANIAGTNYPTIAVTTGAAGSVNHTLDVGFYSCPTITVPSASQAICVGSAGTNITVRTNQNTASSIQFVQFTTDQMAGASPTATESAAIYAGTAMATVTPTGASSPYTATYTWNSADFPNVTASAITYYVYAILSPDGGAGCRPTQEIQITVNPPVSAGTPTNPAPICQSGSGLTNINLLNQLTGETAGGAWSQTVGTAVGIALDSVTGILNPNGIASGTYTFRYTVTGIAPCPNDTKDVTVSIQSCCPPKICLPISIMKN